MSAASHCEVPTPASSILLALARRIVAPYLSLPTVRAAMVMGSAAEGVSDLYSDLDVAVYYAEIPEESELTAARESNGGTPRWSAGDRCEGAFAEAYEVRGVECQIVHATVAAWERDMDRVLVELDVTSPLQKALEGMLHGLPLHGPDLIEGWKRRASAYPDALAEAMVRHYFTFFPLWYLDHRFATRDAGLWRQQALVESAYNVLGTLAGLNRLYFSAFQFKRTARFIGQMRITPARLADRLDTLLNGGETAAIELEELVGELAALVEQHMPQVDTSATRSRLGQRQQAWSPPL